MPSALTRPTLVLNRHWQPVGVVSVARALSMLWAEAAQAIDPETYESFDWIGWIGQAPREGDPVLRSARFTFRAPEVVALRSFDRIPSPKVSFSRKNVAKRDHATCQYCGAQPGMDVLTIDHVLPRAQGGTSTWENCVTACGDCNARKADRTPEQAGMALRKIPARPSWKPLYSLKDYRVPSWSRFLGTIRAEAAIA